MGRNDLQINTIFFCFGGGGVSAVGNELRYSGVNMIQRERECGGPWNMKVVGHSRREHRYDKIRRWCEPRPTSRPSWMDYDTLDTIIYFLFR